MGLPEDSEGVSRRLDAEGSSARDMLSPMQATLGGIPNTARSQLERGAEGGMWPKGTPGSDRLQALLEVTGQSQEHASR